MRPMEYGNQVHSVSASAKGSLSDHVEGTNCQRIFFSVGEPSGDLHASKLIRLLKRKLPNHQVEGLGGPLMREAGCHLHYELTNLAVVGIQEVIPKLREFFRVADIAEAEFRKGNVRAVVLVDFPGFNWHIAKRAKKYGIPVFYYLPPQLWAWAGWRIRKMRRWVDHVLCNLPFEKEWYATRGVDVYDVGHPFFDEVSQRVLDERFLQRYPRNGELRVAILPGSRGHEVTRNWPVQLELIRRLHRDFPQCRFLLAGYKSQQVTWCRSQLAETDVKLPIDFCVGKTSEILAIADLTVMVSGSVSLEVMARKVPAVVMYRPSRLTLWLGKALATCKYISLPNLIAGSEVMKEFISAGSVEAAVEPIYRETSRLIADRELRSRQQKELQELTEKYSQPGATARAANLIASMLSSESQGETLRQEAA